MTLAALLLLTFQQQAVRDDQCVACHEHQALDVKDTLHEKAEIGCVSCHGPDEIANEKHLWKPGFRRGRLPQVAELCGSCHKAVFDVFKPSAHFVAASKDDGVPRHRSSCSSCHGHHTTQAASSRRILAACLKCHEDKSPEMADARGFFKRLGDQGRAVTALKEQMNRLARRPGIRIADLAAALEAGNADHRALEIAQHGMTWTQLGTDADASAARAAAAYNALASREEAFSRRFLGLGLFLGLLVLSAALIVRRARTLQGAS